MKRELEEAAHKAHDSQMTELKQNFQKPVLSKERTQTAIQA